ncbi:MAG: aldo/keto reductase, partial [Nitrospinaceae bacterium]|nr:aldo/keto reductase [Nitrospinaceae bacterium]NIR53282.1 aldo/keto reductase [Nitrospinaceae bacterium]NIS83683.1 aldo/keto reductase [Nitrospinaceae bacterium]NIT80956.1 aldo/keto reductase [Nitrospinaceae bacterium]NIU42810.1 aldo/keto reductase [Nitrospinaceae bacterium]
TCGQTAINWVLRQPGIATALVGVKNEKQMEENVKATGWEPEPEFQEQIEEIFAPATSAA